MCVSVRTSLVISVRDFVICPTHTILTCVISLLFQYIELHNVVLSFLNLKIHAVLQLSA